MSNRPPWLFAALTAALILAPMLASAQPGHTPIGKKGEIELDRPTHIGATLLQPGHYQVQHKIVDGQHALRIGFWGALAMAITAGVGTLFGAAR